MNIQLTPNHQPSPIDNRDRICSLPVAKIPPEVDLKPSVFEVEDQGHINSCTANAGCSALELMFKKNGTPKDFSRLYLYHYTRLLGGISGDSGSYPRDIGKALLNYGTCLEDTWAYTPENIVAAPTEVAIQEASQYKIKGYSQIISNKLYNVKQAVAQGIPVLLNIAVFGGMYSLTGSWKTHNWDFVESPSNPVLGWHEVLIIGYDDVSNKLLVENSWGPGWADGGFFGIPYSMIDTPAFGELWVIEPNINIQYTEPDNTVVDVVKAAASSIQPITLIGVGLLILAVIKSLGIV